MVIFHSIFCLTYTLAKFVTNIILYPPKEWKKFSCFLKQTHGHFQSENSKCLRVPDSI